MMRAGTSSLDEEELEKIEEWRLPKHMMIDCDDS